MGCFFEFPLESSLSIQYWISHIPLKYSVVARLISNLLCRHLMRCCLANGETCGLYAIINLNYVSEGTGRNIPIATYLLGTSALSSKEAWQVRLETKLLRRFMGANISQLPPTTSDPLPYLHRVPLFPLTYTMGEDNIQRPILTLPEAVSTSLGSFTPVTTPVDIERSISFNSDLRTPGKYQ
jgi:hypothetical protein